MSCVSAGKRRVFAFDVFRYFLLFASLRPSLDLICPSSMNRPISRPAASCLNITASGQRAVAFLFHFWRCYSTFRRSVAHCFRPSCIVLRRRVHCPSTCLALSSLSVIALMFSFRPYSLISALTVYLHRSLPCPSPLI
jgi:hypothetical protein